MHYLHRGRVCIFEILISSLQQISLRGQGLKRVLAETDFEIYRHLDFLNKMRELNTLFWIQ